MKPTTKKVYSLVSACLIVLLTLLLTVGALMPTFKLNMASSRASELFGNCSLTSGLVLDEADVGVGKLLGVVFHLGDVKVINKIAFAEKELRDIQESIYETEASKMEAAAEAWAKGDADPDLSSYDERIEDYEKEKKDAQKELDEFKKSVGEEELKALEEKLKDEGFLDTVYTYMVIFATYEDIIWSGSGDNPEYNQYNSDGLTSVLTLFSMALPVVAIIAAIIWAIVVVIALVKGAIALLTGYKSADTALLDKLYPALATSMVAFPLMCVVLTKMLLGSSVTMGAGLKFSIVIVALLALVRVANKLLLVERCDFKKIVRTVITLVSVVLIFCSLNAITNLGLYDAHLASSNEITPVAFEAKKTELIAEKTAEALEKGEKVSLESITSAAEYDAKIFVTAQKLENIIPVALIPLLMAILATVVLSSLLERLGDKQYKNKAGEMKNYRPAFVVAAIILVCAVFVSTLGVGTVQERNDAYNEEGVHFIWNAHEADNSTAKVQYDLMVKSAEETEKLAGELAEKVKSESNDELKTELKFQQNMMERTSNLCGLAAESIGQNQKGLNATVIIMSVLLVALEILYMLSPKLVDKLVPAALQEKLAGFAAEPDAVADEPAEEVVDAPATAEEAPAKEAAPVEENTPEADE